MEQKQRSPKPAEKNLTQLLIMTVCILVAVLVVVVCIALVIHFSADSGSSNETTPSTESTTQTELETEYIGLTVLPSNETEILCLEKNMAFSGTSDPQSPVTVNGTEIQRNADGSFQHTVSLSLGTNTFVFSHKEETVTYTVIHRYNVQKYLPDTQTQYNCGATVQISLFVRNGSELKVTLGDKEISMRKSDNQLGTGVAEGFVLYQGSYDLPDTNTRDLDLGQVQYAVTYEGITETYTSSNVICKKSTQILASDPSVTPNYGKYMDVGSGYIAEIITYNAETFNGKTTDDYSSPLNNYLPEGTMDYCSVNTVGGSTVAYRPLRCGYRVYETKRNMPMATRIPVVNCYKGTLPDHNEVGLASLSVSGHHTVLTFNTMWKAPFFFDIAPQSYNNPGTRDFRITNLTAEYIDITFCYATVFNGTVQIPSNNPLFKSAELIRRDSDCTLRLRLKKTGGFYGWDAYYNENDQLCFSFLNPVKATAAENLYGVNLAGITVMIDVGHGGADGGAVGKDANGNQVEEADRNLALALALKKELESVGATVVMNRETDVRLTADERFQLLRQLSPDICIAIHHNAIDGHPDYGGLEVFYFTPFSMNLAKEMEQESEETEIYARSYLGWHTYYLSRQTNCPVVLMENGYLTNVTDATNSTDPVIIQKKAAAMTQGVANYFLQMNQ